MTTSPPQLPKRFFDAHHHFLDIKANGTSFQAFLGSLVPDEVYLPADYHRDIVEPLKAAGVTLVGSTHMECMPDDGVAETAWVESMSNDASGGGTKCTVQAIVASADLTQPTLEQQLIQLRRVSPEKFKGIRWILDCVGKFQGGKTATHVATSRHDGIDYLRGSDGGYDGSVVPEFERGFALLEKYGLCFDLQCAPVQLPAAAELFKKFPNIPVVIDHLGKPRTLLGPDSDLKATVPDEKELNDWQVGMTTMAALPNVFVKISMLGYSVPGWIRTPARIALMKQLVTETVALFGPKRCMVATNFWKNAALSDSDGLSDVGPDPVELVTLLNDFLNEYSDEDRDAIFCGTAKSFYKVN